MRGLVVALCLCLGSEAGAYCLAKANANIPFPAWKTIPVTYRISDNLTDAKTIAAIEAAFTAWGSVACSKLSFKKGTPFTACLAKPCAAGSIEFGTSEPYIFVFWVTTAWDQFKNPTTPTQPYASYAHFGQDNVGGIVSASIAVNAKDYTMNPDISGGCTGAVFDVQNFMMPLVGSVIGLSDTDPLAVQGSVMESGLKFCSIAKHVLTQDDKNGIYYHYTDGTCPKPPQPGGNGCSVGSTPTGDGPPPVTGDGPGVARDGGVLPGGEGGPGPGTEAGGAQCSSNEQCGAGEICDVTGRCVKPEGEDDGCCRVGHTRRQSVAPVALLMLALLLALRRRRQR